MSLIHRLYQPAIPFIMAFLLIILSLPACSLFDGNDRNSADSSFRENHQKWQAMDYAEYTFTLDRYCFCGGGLYPAKVVVKADTIFSVLDPHSQKPVSIDSTLTYEDVYPTVEDLFDLIKDAMEKDADRLDVEYNNFSGFPWRIDIDYSKQIADEEIRYEITSFSGSSHLYPV
ncbi:DUF6174 domain-containing protein [Fodinibius salsisoli]|uniref:Beta-lactamase-inhibitor-like, PepSY-like n=1 Tax=Fodinibius salsisoli TaxID=2820877 RepID=A0ABT3PKI5_9BACT|nr:DUF6174 domain-containing protein [Fodinibius salsisoli]MCW9706436.1 hypothetical protein [Fodinibius salsisoli]